MVLKIFDVVCKVCRPYGRKDVTIHHDTIKLYVQCGLWLKILEQM